MSGPCKPAFFGLSGRPPFSPANSPTSHARLPEDFYHCYSRRFVDNLRPTASPLALFERRLAEERTNFRSLVRDQRRTLAESFMKDRSVTVTAVVHTVGYAETALLSHVFNVWTGPSPRAFVWRERHAAAGSQ